MKKSEKELKQYEMRICATVNEMEENVRDRFKALAHISDQLADLSKKYEEEAKQIEFEAEQANRPLYQLRTKIIKGEDFDTEEIKTSEFDQRLEEIQDENYEKIQIKEFKEVAHLVDQTGIPGFWYNAMKHNNVLGTQIEKVDEPLLRQLYDIEYIKQEDSSDFILKFHFHPNDYMQNTVLTKRYIMEDEGKIKQVDCTKVKWRPGKNLLEKEKPKKGKKNKNKGKEIEEQETFFRFFTSKESWKGSPDHDDLDSEDELRLDELEEDYDNANEIVDDLIPNALEYYLNIAEDEPIEEVEGEGEGEGDDEQKAAQPDGETIQDGKEVNNDANSEGSMDD